jgi:hypothetical protein
MLQDLPLGGLIAVVFGATFLVTGGVYLAIMALAARGRANAFKAFSPGMLPPMGLLFGLIVGFMAAQIWSDAGRAQDAVDREASALRSVVLLAESFPGTTARSMLSLVVRSVLLSTRSGRRWRISEPR